MKKVGLVLAGLVAVVAGINEVKQFYDNFKDIILNMDWIKILDLTATILFPPLCVFLIWVLSKDKDKYNAQLVEAIKIDQRKTHIYGKVMISYFNGLPNSEYEKIANLIYSNMQGSVLYLDDLENINLNPEIISLIKKRIKKASE